MPDLLQEVRAAVAERRRADQRYRRALQAARDHGVSMGELAEAAGVTRQGVFKLTSTPVRLRRKRRGVVQPVSADTTRDDLESAVDDAVEHFLATGNAHEAVEMLLQVEPAP